MNGENGRGGTPPRRREGPPPAVAPSPPRGDSWRGPEIVFIHPPPSPEQVRAEERVTLAAEVIAWLYRASLKELSD